jgi:glycerophosphoryl diester phosphodiesterase
VVTTPLRPLLLGHRGARPVRRFGARNPQSQVPVENTLAAFEYALAHGCDGFEFDVRFTRDKRAVLCHDPQVDGKKISATNYSDLGRHGNELACLEDVLARFGDTAFLDIELKDSGNEERVIAAVRQKLPSRGYVVSSFFPQVLLRLNRLDSSVTLGYICDRPQYVEIWTELPIAVLIPQYNLVSQVMIDDAHRLGVRLFTWTVNQHRDLLRLAKSGVDGLISDDPALLRRTFL